MSRWINRADGVQSNRRPSGALLPSGFSSFAYSIDGSGNVYGIVRNTTSFTIREAVEWSPVPEPETILLMLIGGPALILFHSRRNCALGGPFEIVRN